MKTFEGKYVLIHYNGDLSGTVTITRKSSGQEFQMVADDLVEWLVEIVRERQLRQVERASAAEILRGGL